MAGLRRTVAPTTEPVTLAQVKAHLRVDGEQEDTLLGQLIAAARDWAEQYLWRSLMEQTWELSLDAMPSGRAIEIPRAPLLSVTTVSYMDSDGTEQTLAATSYIVDGKSSPGRIVLATGIEWPVTDYPVNALTVLYKAGSTTAAGVPESIRHGILMHIGHLYENRETVAADGKTASSEVPMSTKSLYQPYRMGKAVG